MFDRISTGMWWDRAWTLTRGCTPVSPGCDHCWSESMSHQRKDGPAAATYGMTDSCGHWMGKAEPLERHLDKPLRVRKPQVWSVWNDLFHDDMSELFIVQALAIMAQCPRHFFIVCTKRHQRMLDVMSSPTIANDVWVLTERGLDAGKPQWPLPNVMGMVTVEDQARADERIPALLAAPWAWRGVSCEPLLGPVDLTPYFRTGRCDEPIDGSPCDWSGTVAFDDDGISHCPCCGSTAIVEHDNGLDWIIAGGETSRDARPMHPAWARSLRDQATAAGVPFFFKQWGEWQSIDRPWEQDNIAPLASNERWMNYDGGHGFHGEQVYRMRRVGKRAAGALIDEKEWREIPEVAR